MKKAFWDKKNPKKKSTKLTSAQKAAAKARAKAAGRPYPNLVDNAAVLKKKSQLKRGPIVPRPVGDTRKK
jgi:hypothetical protein